MESDQIMTKTKTDIETVKDFYRRRNDAIRRDGLAEARWVDFAPAPPDAEVARWLAERGR